MSGGICLGRGVGPVRSGGRSVSWVGGMGYGDWRAGSTEGLNRSWVNGRAGSELGRQKGWIGDGSTEGLDRSWGGKLGLWWMGLRRLAMEEKRETQREDGEENVRKEAAGMK